VDDPTILDVAREAGVSVSTVSRVLNDRADVAEATRRRVHGAIAQLGFAPRLNARRLVQRQSFTISLLFPADLAGPSGYELDFVVGAARATEERDYFFKLVTSPLTGEGLLGMFRGGVVDGVILMQIREQDERVELLAERDLPFVMIGRPADPGGHAYVDFDFEAAARSAVDLLAMLGHRRVAFLGRPQAQLAARLGAAVRLQRGFDAGAAAHGLQPVVQGAELDAGAVRAAVHRVLDADPAVTAFVLTHGPSTIGAYRALADRGLRVPEDVSVVGVATASVADLLTPPLTCAVFPSAELGRRAAEMLTRLLEGRGGQGLGQPEQVVLPASITLRGSTGPVRA